MALPRFISKPEQATVSTKKARTDATGETVSPGSHSSLPKLAGMSVDPDDLSLSDSESIGDDGPRDSSRSTSPDISTYATCSSGSVENDGQPESSKGSAPSTSSLKTLDDTPTEYEGRGLRRNNHDFTATFDFIKKATSRRKANVSKKEEADGQASVTSASREYLAEYYGWHPAKPRRAMPRSNVFQKDLGHGMIAASNCSEHESDKEVEDECEGSGDVYFRRGRASSTRGKSSR